MNVVAPLALTQLALPALRARGGAVVNITSDAAVEAYPGWGGYGSAKAALEQASRVLAAEEPDVRVWWVDPGDLRTRMHQEAFPGEDISDRPLPDTVVPAFLRLLADAPARPAGSGSPSCSPVRHDGRRLRAARRPGGARAARGARAHPRRGTPARRPAADRRVSPPPVHRSAGVLRPGDVLVVNTSATLPAAVPVAGGPLAVHFSTETAGRHLAGRAAPAGRQGHRAVRRRRAGRALPAARRGRGDAAARSTRAGRLWVADGRTPPDSASVATSCTATASRSGTGTCAGPGRCRYYQTVFATHPGSAEMPSAGRPFTDRLVTRLVAAGVHVAPLLLHTGVASPEAHERPYPERFSVPAATARAVDQARADGGRVIAVGTTVGAGAGDRRDGAGRRGLDRPGRHAGARGAGRRRAAHRLPRAARLAPGHARGGRRHRHCWNAATPRRSTPGTCGTSSATSISF